MLFEDENLGDTGPPYVYEYVSWECIMVIQGVCLPWDGEACVKMDLVFVDLYVQGKRIRYEIEYKI